MVSSSAKIDKDHCCASSCLIFFLVEGEHVMNDRKLATFIMYAGIVIGSGMTGTMLFDGGTKEGLIGMAVGIVLSVIHWRKIERR